MKFIAKINIVSEKVERASLTAIIIFMSVLLIINSIARKVGTLIYFVDETAMFLMILLTFIGMPHAARKGQHIAMSAILDLVPPKVKKIMIFVISIIGAIVMFYMAYISTSYVYKVYYFKQLLTTLQIPYWIILVIVPIGFFMTGVNFSRTIIKNIKEKEEIWVSAEQKEFDYTE